MLGVGDIAPEIRATATDGRPFVLSEQGGLCTVIYFFPKAFTPNCTLETRIFGENYAEIGLAGASLVGISTDPPATQCRFAERLKTPFPLIADADRTISSGFGVLWPVLGLARRATFVVDAGRRVLAVFHHELRVRKIRDEVLKFVHDLRTQG